MNALHRTSRMDSLLCIFMLNANPENHKVDRHKSILIYIYMNRYCVYTLTLTLYRRSLYIIYRL